MKLKGKVLQIGYLYDYNSRGMLVECDDSEFLIAGMTKKECRAVNKWLGKEIEVTIASAKKPRKRREWNSGDMLAFCGPPAAAPK